MIKIHKNKTFIYIQKYFIKPQITVHLNCVVTALKACSSLQLLLRVKATSWIIRVFCFLFFVFKLWHSFSVLIYVHAFGLIWQYKLNSCLFFDPATEFGNCCIDAWFVSASTAITPTDHSSQEHTIAGRTGQRTPRVSLKQKNAQEHR